MDFENDRINDTTTYTPPQHDVFTEDGVLKKCAWHKIVLSDGDESYKGAPDAKSTDSQMLDTLTLSLKTLAISVPTKKNQKNPKMADYDLATCTVLDTAIDIYAALLLTEDLFPDGVKELDWAQGTWSLACTHHNANISIDKVLSKLVLLRNLSAIHTY